MADLTVTTLDGLPALRFANTAAARLSRPADPGAPLDGVTALTEEAWGIVNGSGSGSIFRLGGTPASPQVNARFESWTQGTGRGAGKTSCFEVGQNWWDGSHQHNQSTEGRSGDADGATLRHLFFIRQSGVRAAMFDGEADISTTTGDVLTPWPGTGNTIHVMPGDVVEMGAGSGAQRQAAAMTLGLYTVWPRALSPTERAVLHRGQAGDETVGFGAEELPGDPPSPVAMPVAATVAQGVQTDIDVAAGAFRAAGAAVPTLSTAGTAADGPGPAHGNVQAAGGQARLIEDAAYVGPDSFGFTLAASGRLLVPARCIVTVTGGGPPPPPPPESWRDVTAPALSGWATIPPLGQVTGPKVPINSDADLGKIGAGVPGTTYVIAANANLTGSVTVSGNGTKAAPIVIRGADDGTNRANFPKWTYSGNTNLTITGNHVYVQKICWVGIYGMRCNVNTGGAANRVSIERCWSYGHSGGNLYGIAPYNLDPNSTVRFYRVRYCEHGNPGVRTGAGFWDMGGANSSSNHPLNIFIYRNLISYIDSTGHGAGFGTVLLSIGRGENDDGLDNKAAMYENRVRDLVNLSGGEGFEMKNAGTVLAYNTFEQSPDPSYQRFRHGHNGQMIGNVWVDGAASGPMGIESRGSGHTIINNWSVALGPGAPVTSGSPAGTATIRLWGGNIDGSMPLALVKPEQSPPRPNNIGLMVGGNRMAVVIGYPDPGGGTPLGDVACVVGPAGGSLPYRNRSVTVGSDGDRDYAGRGQSRAQYGSKSPAYGTPFGGSSTITNQAIKGANYDLVPVRLFDADVGIGCRVYP